MSLPSEVVITPEDMGPRITNWYELGDSMPQDNGMLTFSVRKNNGLIVAIGSERGGGWAAIIDRHGAHDDNLLDDATSISMISRLPQMNGAASHNSIVRGYHLDANNDRHITVRYSRTFVEVTDASARLILLHNEFNSNADMKFNRIGFGHTGRRSGHGVVKNIKLQQSLM